MASSRIDRHHPERLKFFYLAKVKEKSAGEEKNEMDSLVSEFTLRFEGKILGKNPRESVGSRALTTR